jgi:hypothetical protein
VKIEFRDELFTLRTGLSGLTNGAQQLAVHYALIQFSKRVTNLYFRVLHPVARNIKLYIIIPPFSQQLTKHFIMCPLYSRHVSALILGHHQVNLQIIKRKHYSYYGSVVPNSMF